MYPKQESDPKLMPDKKAKAPEGPIGFSTTLLRSDEALPSLSFPRDTSASLPTGDTAFCGSLPSSSFEAFSTMNPMSPPSLPPSQLPSSSTEFEKVISLPQPLGCLQGNRVPAFLSKTFDLVDDPLLDPIISWGSTGVSFVRQLNTYGFRKIDTDKWEFFNEAFQRGKRHLLKNIQRRRSPQSQQVGSYIGPYSDAGKVGLEFEIERLRKERSVLMQEMVELQQQQRTILQHVRQVNQRLQSAELVQKQMVSFLARLLENPAFLTRLQHEKEERDKRSPEVRRKFVKQHQGQAGISDFLKEGQIVGYQPDWRNVTISSEAPEMYPVSLEECPNYLSQALAKELSEGAENLISDELATVHEVMPTADTIETIAEKSSNFGLEDTLFKGKNVMSSNQEVLAEDFVPFPVELTKEVGFPEFSLLGNESIIKQEDKWNTSFTVSGAPSSSGNEPWGNPINYEVPEFGVTSVMSDMWDSGLL